MHISETTASVRYLLDNSGFVSGGEDKRLTLWSFTNDKIAWSEKKHNGTITDLAMHPVGGVLASGAWTGTIKIWDLENGTDLITVEAHSNRVYGLAFSPSGGILASGSKDSQICLWQMPDSAILAKFTGHSGWVRGLEFVNENTLISIGADGFCKIWRISTAFPVTASNKIYNSSDEVLNEYRRFMARDNE